MPGRWRHSKSTAAAHSRVVGCEPSPNTTCLSGVGPNAAATPVAGETRLHDGGAEPNATEGPRSEPTATSDVGDGRSGVPSWAPGAPSCAGATMDPTDVAAPADAGANSPGEGGAAPNDGGDAFDVTASGSGRATHAAPEPAGVGDTRTAALGKAGAVAVGSCGSASHPSSTAGAAAPWGYTSTRGAMLNTCGMRAQEPVWLIGDVARPGPSEP